MATTPQLNRKQDAPHNVEANPFDTIIMIAGGACLPHPTRSDVSILEAKAT